jgi:RNA polymerase sigma-70 factor (ECF subfamily)
MLAKEVAAVEQAACPVAPGPSEDVLLARALIEGRRDAAPSAWKRFQPVVQTTLRRMLGSGPDLPDLTQEVFLRFFGKVRELKKLESLRFFVTAIAIRRAREEIKRRRVRRSASPFLGDKVPLWSGTVNPEARDLLGHVSRAMATLDPQEQTVYLLRQIQGLELAEIASTLGISVSTVRRRLRRVARILDELIESDDALSDYRGRA